MSAPTLIYSSRTTNWPVIGVAIAGGVALALLGRPWAGPWPGMIVPLAVFLGVFFVALVTSTSLRVTTGPRGVQIWCGVFGWPRFTYPAARIRDAEIITISVMQTWNGGVHWSRHRGWTFVLRSGPAVRLTLTNGRHVTVGVADGEAALAALRPKLYA